MKPQEPELDRFGFPLPYSFDFESPTGEEQAPKRSIGGKIRFVLRMALIAAIGVALWNHFDIGAKLRSGIARHYGEKAERLYFRNDLPGALAEAERAVGWSPTDTKLLMIRSKLRRFNKDYRGSLADAEEVSRLDPTDEHADQIRRVMYHVLHEHRKAAEAATHALTQGMSNRGELLNDRAYARALGDFELTEALADIDEAIRQSANDNASYIDTRAYVLFRQKKYDEALKEMNRAIMLTEKARRTWEELITKNELRRRDQLFDYGQLKAIEENLAVMYHHRGEILEKQEKKSDAERDFKVADDLGFNPEEGIY